MRRSFLLVLFLIVGAALLLTTKGCGGGGGTSATGLGSASQVTGTVFAPSGTTVAGATVYIPAASSSVSASKGIKAVSDGADDGTTCDDPPSIDNACASTCSQADGTFSLSVSDCAATLTEGKIVKGTFSDTFAINCTESTCAIAETETKLETGATTLAVVTGAYDNIEDVLAKLGYGTLGEDGHLKVGTEKFKIYRGGGSLDSQLTDTATYKSSTALFTDIDEMNKYDIIFINCGTDESLVSTSVSAGGEAASVTKTSHDHAHHIAKSLPASVISNIQSYINGGKRLYVTDWAYDFIEQAFPAFMDFEDGGSDAATAETQNDAEDGKDGIVSNATVKDSTMLSWLGKQSSNTIDSDSSPNGSSCTTTVNDNASSLLSASTIRIGDFLSRWIVMKGAHSGQSPKVWIEGPVTFTSTASVSETTETRPLTVSNTVGTGTGKILYSSYHTAHSCPTTGQWPQERVLQYLIFEVAD